MLFRSAVPYYNPKIVGEPRVDDTVYPFRLSGSGPVSRTISLLRYTGTVKGKPDGLPLVEITYGSDAELKIEFRRPFPF